MALGNQAASILIKRRPVTLPLSALKSTVDLSMCIIVLRDLNRIKENRALTIHQKLSSFLIFQAQQATLKTLVSLFLSLTIQPVWKWEILTANHNLLARAPLAIKRLRNPSASIEEPPKLMIRKQFIEWSTRTISCSKRKRKSTSTHSSVCKSCNELNSGSRQQITWLIRLLN